MNSKEARCDGCVTEPVVRTCTHCGAGVCAECALDPCRSHCFICPPLAHERTQGTRDGK